MMAVTDCEGIPRDARSVISSDSDHASQLWRKRRLSQRWLMTAVVEVASRGRPTRALKWPPSVR